MRPFFRGLSAVLLCSLLVGLSAGAARAVPPDRAPELKPGWLLGGDRPQADPLQVGLEERLLDSRTKAGYDRALAYLKEHSGTPEFSEGGCQKGIKEYTKALELRRQLQVSLSAMQDAFDALSKNQLAQVGLAATRTAQIAAQVAAFAGAYGALGATAATVTFAGGTVLNLVNAAASYIGILASAYYDHSRLDKVDLALTNAGRFVGQVTLMESNNQVIKALGEKAVGKLIVIATAIKTIHDLFGDYDKFKQTESAATEAYFQAGRLYNTLLAQLQQAVTGMNTQFSDCPPKKQTPPTASGTPPPDCGAVGRDYADPTCTAQSRNGTLSLSPHQVRAGGTLTGTISGRCKRHRNNDFSQPADEDCPVDWSGLLRVGAKQSGCTPAASTCTVSIPKAATPTKYLIVTVGITNEQGTGISKDYYAIVK